MADATNCNLASYGYDYVFAATQASMNSDMKAYLSNAPLTFNYYCFLADPETNEPTVPIALEDLIKQTGGANPFNIPDGTPHTDPNVQALTNARFAVGIKICVGFPQDVPPVELPDIIELGDSVDQVTFRVFCTQSAVIQNTKPGGWSANGNWNVWSQPPNQLWTFKTSVKLVSANVDSQLNSANVYLSSSQKQQVLQQLQNRPADPFTLQQLFLDVENADVLSAPTIEGMAAGPAQRVLSGQAATFWPMFAKQCTYPALAIVAQLQTPDTSSASLQVSSFQRVVNPFKSSNGGEVLTPSKEEAGVVTLDYLCMTNGTQPPTAEAFTWNWVQPSDIDSESGTIAINRSVYGNELLCYVGPHASAYCYTVNTTVKDRVSDQKGDLWRNPFATATAYQPAQTFSVLPDGDILISMKWTAANDPGTKCTNGSLCGSTECELDIVPSYECTVVATNNQITVTQTFQVQVTLNVSGFVMRGTRVDYTGTSNVVDRTITDTYDMSVDQSGNLNFIATPNAHKKTDTSEELPGNAWFMQTSELSKHVRGLFYFPVPVDFGPPIAYLRGLQNSIFPGGNVFTYKDVRFSQYGDLLCSFTYLDPNEAVASTITAPTPAAEVVTAIQRPKEALTPSAAPSVTMTCSSDMIQSYVPGQIVNATSKFEALQTDDGHSILLGLSSSNMLQAILEQSGVSSTGWQQMDITSTALASIFASDPKATIKTFDANQSAVNGTIGISAIVTSGGSDSLILSLGNPNSAASWTTTLTSLTWKLVPFDAASDGGTTSTNITIVNVMFAEALFDGTQYIIVDIDRSTASATKDIARYYVNPSATDHCWTFHDVPVDIQSGSYQSCVGRFSVDSYGTDAVFTSGTSGTSAQLVYVPLENPFGQGPPPFRTLSLPGGVQATAIATSRASDGSTDLFAIGGSTLYMFAADSPPSVSVATVLISSSFFNGTDHLTAMTHGGVTTIWGRNTSKQIYYVSCPNGQFTTAASWSTPLPLVTGIDKISPFTNRSGGSNTIFAAGGQTLRRLEQATETGAKLWRQEALVLQPQQTTSQPLSFNSYTTSIQVSDEQKLPASDISVLITTTSRAPVYINGIYHVLSPAPTTVVTDKTGIVTIVESAHKSINGTTLTVTCCGQTTTIDPTEKHFQTISSLGTADGTADKLKAATIQQNVRVGGTFGPSKTSPLVGSSTSAANLSKAATSLSRLNSVYGKVKSGAGSSPSPSSALPASSAPSSLPDGASASLFGDIGHFFEAAAGDVFHALKTLAKDVVHVVHIVEQAASGVWHFVVTIAGQAYHAVLDTVEAVVGAVEWVFNAIETVIEDIIRFLEFLLEWDDITRTKDVIHNLTQLCLQGQINLLPTAKTALNTQIASLEAEVNNWAGDTSWMAQIGQATKQPMSANTTNPTAGQTSGSQMLANHYKNNASNLAIVGTLPADDSVEQLFDDLLTALENEGKTLGAAYSAIVELSHRFTSQPLEDSLKQLAGIVAEVMLSTFENVGDALLDVLTTLSKNAMSILNTNIYIPVVSDILEALDVPPLSILDLFCWIPAVAFTMAYKIATGNTPFPDNSEVNSLKNARSWPEVQALLGVKPDAPLASRAQQNQSVVLELCESSSSTLSQEFRRDLYIYLHSMGALQQTILTFVTVLEVELPSQDNPFSKPKTIISIIRAMFDLIAALAVPQDPAQNKTLAIVSDAQAVVKFVAPIVLGRNKKALEGSGPSTVFPEQDGRARGAMVKVIVGYWGVMDTLLHLFELGNEASNSDQTGAILIETISLLGQVGTVAYCEALNDPEAKEEAMVVIGVVGMLQAGLQGTLCTTV